MKNRFLIFFFLILLGGADSMAVGGVSLGYGRSKSSVNIYHLGIQRDFGINWFESKTGQMSGYHEASFNYWEHGSETAKQVAYSPVFTYEFTGFNPSVSPYLEGGIGGSYITKTEIGGRNMSTHFLFEDRIGFGIEIGTESKHDLNFKYLHYSNADLKNPNEGTDIFMFSYIYSF
jgi:lipid A 3-O-deacylase